METLVLIPSSRSFLFYVVTPSGKKFSYHEELVLIPSSRSFLFYFGS